MRDLLTLQLLRLAAWLCTQGYDYDRICAALDPMESREGYRRAARKRWHEEEG